MVVTTQSYQKTEFKRKMSGAERRFLRLPNANIVIGARVRGRVDPSLLPDAIAKIKHKHPLLNSRIQLEEPATGSAGWFTQENVPKILISARLRHTLEEWIEVAAEEQKKAFSIETGPLIRIVVLEAADDFDLIITAHHSICDGRSLVYLIRDILTALAHPDQASGLLPIVPIAAETCLPPSVSVSWITRFIIQNINRKWLRKGLSFSEQAYQDLHQEFWQKHHATILRWELPKVQTATLVNRCKQENVSVNSALYAAFLKAQQHVQAGRQKKTHDSLRTVIVPIDFRNRLTTSVGEAVGFYASAIVFKLKIKPKKSFWDTARILDKRIHQKLTDKNIFASQKMSLLAPSFMDGMIFAKHGKCDDPMVVKQVKRKGLDKLVSGVMVSNLGRVDIPVVYGDFSLEALLGPVAYSDGIEKVLEVVTVGGKMQFTLTAGETLIAPDTVNQIKEMAMTYLEESA